MNLGRLHRCNLSPFRYQRPIRRICQRKFSAGSSAASITAPGPSSLSILASLTTELDKIAPRFDINASQLTILQQPSDFYESLLTKIRNAKSRIFLSTLYIGKTEHELVASIRKALETNPDLRVTFLTDALRGTREAPETSCASLLAPLVTDFGAERVEIRMYHTPNLTGVRKRIIPKRINEGWGLQHMKLYGIDDEIIISGANLSNDYFSNRQDRYYVVSSKSVTDYYAKVNDATSSISFLVNPDPSSESGFQLSWPDTNFGPSPLIDPPGFIRCATSLMNPLIKSNSDPLGPSMKITDTSIYPLAQLTPLLKPDTSTEHPGLTAVLKSLSLPTAVNSSWLFTAGYFNIQSDLSSLLISSKSAQGTVVTASPWANGFYGSKGISGMLPAAYTLLSRRFLERVQRANKSNQIQLKEWRHGTVGEPGGWTYHAKGLWVALAGDQNPSITLVGSSNYTKRSYSLDLEMNALVVTRNEDLKKRMADEQRWLTENTKIVNIDDFAKIERRVGLKVRIALWIVGLVGGAL